MARQIGFSAIEEAAELLPFSAASTATRLAEQRIVLKCHLLATDKASLEAVRYARRAMLREEGTRGAEPGEPLLEDAIFSAFDVVWAVRPEEGERGRAKLAELFARANRALQELSVAGHA